jgi:hypothetical protein
MEKELGNLEMRRGRLPWRAHIAQPSPQVPLFECCRQPWSDTRRRHIGCSGLNMLHWRPAETKTIEK